MDDNSCQVTTVKISLLLFPNMKFWGFVQKLIILLSSFYSKDLFGLHLL